MRIVRCFLFFPLNLINSQISKFKSLKIMTSQTLQMSWKNLKIPSRFLLDFHPLQLIPVFDLFKHILCIPRDWFKSVLLHITSLNL